jgi:hypothetical protein
MINSTKGNEVYMKYLYKSNPEVCREILKVCSQTYENVKANCEYAVWFRKFENKVWEPLAKEVALSDEDIKMILTAFHKTKGIVAFLPYWEKDCRIFKNLILVTECSREMLLKNICREW